MANGLGSFSIGMDPRQFLQGRGSIVGNRFVPMAPTPQPMAPPMAPQPMAPQPMAPQPMTPQPMTPQPMAPQPMTPPPMAPQPMAPPMIPEPPSAFPSEQLNMQPSMGIPTTPPVQEPPPMAPPVMEQPPMAPPMEQPAMGGFFNKVFDTLRGENVTNLDQPVTSTPQPDDSMMRPMPLPPPIARPRIDNRFFRPVGTPPEFRFNNPRLDMDAPTRPLRPDIRLPDIERPFRGFGLDGILGGFDRFRPPPPPRFGLPVGLSNRRPFPPSFGESPMRNFREMRGIGLRNPFFGPRRQG
jgi:hypothetical protein